MKLIDLNITDFVNEVDSKSPAPGGGSVSALSGSIGAALLRMVGHLTITKKKFKALDEEHQVTFKKAFDELTKIKEELIVLIDADTDAFNLIMAAFKMPKETDEDKQARSLAIVNATREAIKVPYQVATYCLEGLKKLDIIRQYGNKNCLSDIGVAALSLKTGAIGALMNVKINVPGLSDELEKQDFLDKVDTMYQEIETLSNQFIKQVFESL